MTEHPTTEALRADAARIRRVREAILRDVVHANAVAEARFRQEARVNLLEMVHRLGRHWVEVELDRLRRELVR